MNRFISSTSEQINEMCSAVGIDSVKSLFDFADSVKIKEPFALPEALSEYDLKKVMQNLAGRNISASDAVCFMGAGSYDHFIPSIVNKIMQNAAFDFNVLNSNETRKSIFDEYREYMKRLTGMNTIGVDKKNTSDALIEAIMIAKDETGRNKIVVSRAVNPEYRKVINTTAKAMNIDVKETECSNGDTEINEIEDDTMLVVAQSPNFFGIIEDMKSLSDVAHNAGALFTAIIDPVSLAILSTPAEYNADIAVGNGQAVGGTLYFGTPFMGLFAVNESLNKYIADDSLHGNVFNALQSNVYMAYMGEGLKEVAKTCYSNACYTYERLTATTSFKPLFNKPFYSEFAVKAVKKNVNDLNNRMLDYGMIGGYALKNEYHEFGNSWLIAVTEKRSADEVELFVKEASRLI